MFRPLELFIGLRYTRAKRRNHFVSFISLSSVLGIALGITALITVLSVMNGFQEEVRGRILAMTPHATINRWSGAVEDWKAVRDWALEDARVVGGAPYIRGEAMLNNASLVSGALVQGILPAEENKVSDIGSKMVQGTLDELRPGQFGIILGQALANALGVVVGDKITVITPQASVTPAGILPRLKRFDVVGLFKAGMYEYDRGLALIHVEDAAKLFQYPEGTVNGVRLKLHDLFMAPRFSRELAGKLPETFVARDWTQDHASYFRAVQIEKTAMFVILTLIVAVAAFNIVSMLVMVVTDKQADIAILRTLGATPRSVMGIFIVQGMTIGLVGTVLGLIGGVALATHVDVVVPFIERLFSVKILAPDVYLISDIPSKVQWSDVITIGLVAFGLATLATLYPAWRAARTQPAEALRYE
ncbi:MAG: lipoprotein-releasing ABC transporter permease subunit [Candidatus Competibacter denitrificans]|jgi:lipoprotein-releasing system permease protein|uniref:Outer membrane-specific lipoprotein transporter subunit membrane component of ABC superfamily n=1 Tax=Candidatus Competibacter denitrificans Run_A_D11 TaxID=1400863 RepID=W6M9E5_9GAMM|nr:lipoprotein-releasing ABC transporter permease subunit [Candidatus Competibacter denitrificans]CDI04207.1 outer membrane-specific lipoprotein transporter subunit; membrane component of ABC superfamily [Candidatus Competibacter denitrificans Run_A_D11]HAS87111.1 lipoprotein-releasing system transmembrane subunit LolC [Candidatus Competibacteraceae bacterium]HRC68691.1 lipoprotein-releasing ABC transporter permease subunit [Candidatus Competibacter denitrificans]